MRVSSIQRSIASSRARVRQCRRDRIRAEAPHFAELLPVPKAGAAFRAPPDSPARQRPEAGKARSLGESSGRGQRAFAARVCPAELQDREGSFRMKAACQAPARRSSSGSCEAGISAASRTGSIRLASRSSRCPIPVRKNKIRSSICSRLAMSGPVPIVSIRRQCRSGPPFASASQCASGNAASARPNEGQGFPPAPGAAAHSLREIAVQFHARAEQNDPALETPKGRTIAQARRAPAPNAAQRRRRARPAAAGRNRQLRHQSHADSLRSSLRLAVGFM